ncbi:MAG: YicC/YloC family endoribonuclease [Pseudomonadota bacterium]
MPLKSMTGFARSDGSHKTTSWHWEVRTLNGRGLDMRFRLPQGYEFLEKTLRDTCAKYIARGNCTVLLNIKREDTPGDIKLNHSALEQILFAAKEVQDKFEVETARLDGILALKGVLEFREPEVDNTDKSELMQAIMENFSQVLMELKQAKVAEGSRLEDAIKGQIDNIEKFIQRLEQAPARLPSVIKKHIEHQINRLFEIEASSQFSEERLHQEAILLAAKADIEEEIDRLKSHVAAARDLLADEKPVGRRLDFLTQEFNREANTICSKAGDNDVSHIGLELKAVIDQMREQVQNIE